MVKSEVVVLAGEHVCESNGRKVVKMNREFFKNAKMSMMSETVECMSGL